MAKCLNPGGASQDAIITTLHVWHQQRLTRSRSFAKSFNLEAAAVWFECVALCCLSYPPGCSRGLCSVRPSEHWRSLRLDREPGVGAPTSKEGRARESEEESQRSKLGTPLFYTQVVALSKSIPTERLNEVLWAQRSFGFTCPLEKDMTKPV